MSSILTNEGAMVALKTLRSISMSLSKVQSEISTGKSIETAGDNAAIWAISTVMSADAKSFEAVSGNISLGRSSLAVATNATEEVTDLLTQIKEKVVTAQSGSVDRVQIQADIETLRDQVNSIVGTAQFNGENLISNTSTTAGSGQISVLTSLDRSADGTVTAGNVTIKKSDLSSQGQVIGNTAVATLTDYVTGTNAAITGASTAAARTFTIADTTVAAGIGYKIDLSAQAGNAVIGSGSGGDNPATGVYEYVARDGDTAEDVARVFEQRINGAGQSAYTVSRSGAALTFAFDNNTDGLTVTAAARTAAGAKIGGGIEALGYIDVTTTAGAASALGEMESIIQTAVDAASGFGSASARLENQSRFLSDLVDTLKQGVGALVDSNMEEASARLQALQVQQQLAVQSLSIANQAPQSILALFR